MDLNTLKKRYQDEAEKAINYQARATGFDDELTKAIQQNDKAYAPFENDVNTARNTYYNSTGQLLPTITGQAQYSKDPMLALQALENERGILGTRYQNSQDSLSRRKQTLADLVNSFAKQAGTEVQRQSSLVDLIKGQYDTAFKEDQARKAASAYGNLFGDGGTKPAGNTRVPVGQKDATGRTVIGYDANGNPVYQEDQGGQSQGGSKNIINSIADAANPSNSASIFQNLLGDNYKTARNVIRVSPFENVLSGYKQGSNILNSIGNWFK